MFNTTLTFFLFLIYLFFYRIEGQAHGFMQAKQEIYYWAMAQPLILTLSNICNST